MLIFLSGCHGIGKTTLVNNIDTDSPLVKFTNVDMLSFKGQGFRQQMNRYTIMFEVLENLPTSMDAIIDRSPIDFSVYNKFVVEQDSAEDEQGKQMFSNLIKRYYELGPVITLLIVDDYDEVCNRIKKRGRDGLNEENDEFTRAVWKEFNSLDEIYPQIIKVKFSEAEKYIKDLLSKE